MDVESNQLGWRPLLTCFAFLSLMFLNIFQGDYTSTNIFLVGAGIILVINSAVEKIVDEIRKEKDNV